MLRSRVRVPTLALALGVTLVVAACTGGDPAPSLPAPLPAPQVPDATVPAGALATEPCGPDVCGTIEVPWDWTRPDGPGTTVAFKVLPRTDPDAPAQAPIVGMSGGPGYGSARDAWTFRRFLGPLLEDRDLILMDQRGTGASDAIACDGLQHDRGDFSVASGACAEQLGAAANAYGSAAAADDLAAILGAMDIERVDVIGYSYGTYLAQVFGIRHPSRTRTVVLDSAFDDSFDPFARDAAQALEDAWPTVCERADACPDVLEQIARAAAALEADPLRGVGVDPDGGRHRVEVDDRALAQLLYDASYTRTIYRDVPAALRAHEEGDDVPLLRLAAEDLLSTGAGDDPTAYSQGAYMAVSCADYPTAWDRDASIAEREAQLDTTIEGMPDDAFAPLPNDAWLYSLYEYQLVYGCLRWPSSPAAGVVPTPTRYVHPDLPVLVVNGELDVTTPVSNARAAADAWPGATFVEAANGIHMGATYDTEGCLSGIVRRFIRTEGDAGDPSCAADLPSVHVADRFPVRVADAPDTPTAGEGDASTAGDRRLAWVAGESVADALDRWWNTLDGRTGHGLRGGTFAVTGPYMSEVKPLRLDMDGVRFTEDTRVSGPVVWDRTTGVVTADLEVEGPGGEVARLRIRFPTAETDEVSTVRGSADGRTIDLTLPRLWAP